MVINNPIVTDSEWLQATAVAIQNKDGGSKMEVPDFASRIEQNLQSKAVLDSVIDGSITSIESDVTGIMSYKFYGCTSLVSVDFPNATTIGAYTFRNCHSLEEAIFPNVTRIDDFTLQYCSKLETAVFDKATYIGLGSFQNDTKLKNINIRNIERISASAFWSCSNLNTIVLEKRAVLDNISAFTSCPAIIYVKPEDLSWYSTATNWSTLYAQDRIKSIEDLTGDDLAWYQEQLARYQAA